MNLQKMVYVQNMHYNNNGACTGSTDCGYMPLAILLKLTPRHLKDSYGEIPESLAIFSDKKHMEKIGVWCWDDDYDMAGGYWEVYTNQEEFERLQTAIDSIDNQIKTLEAERAELYSQMRKTIEIRPGEQ